MIRILVTGLIAGLSLIPVASANSFNNFSQAVGDSAEASVRVAAAGGQVALGAVAVPLAAAGALAEGAGNAANGIADEMWNTANAPLTVSDDVVFAQDPPSLSNQNAKPEAE